METNEKFYDEVKEFLKELIKTKQLNVLIVSGMIGKDRVSIQVRSSGIKAWLIIQPSTFVGWEGYGGTAYGKNISSDWEMWEYLDRHFNESVVRAHNQEYN